MEDIVIKVEGLGKRYKVAQREAYQTLRETLIRQAKAPAQWIRNRRNGTTKKDGHWALLGDVPPGSSMIVSTLATVLLLIGGLFYFRRMERRFADVI